MDGIILIDKPQGKTSHQVVQIVKKKLGARKAGHAGTLDPLATGLLVILINKATKLSNIFLNKDKTYEVAVQLFTETDTGDTAGQVIKKEKNKEEIYISLLITQQEDITPTLTTLREYFTIQNILEYLLNLLPLPEPTWNIFN